MEYLGGAERYKRELADRFDPMYQGYGLARGPLGHAYVARARLSIALRRRLKRSERLHQLYLRSGAFRGRRSGGAADETRARPDQRAAGGGADSPRAPGRRRGRRAPCRCRRAARRAPRSSTPAGRDRAAARASCRPRCGLLETRGEPQRGGVERRERRRHAGCGGIVVVDRALDQPLGGEPGQAPTAAASSEHDCRRRRAPPAAECAASRGCSAAPHAISATTGSATAGTCQCQSTCACASTQAVPTAAPASAVDCPRRRRSRPASPIAPTAQPSRSPGRPSVDAELLHLPVGLRRHLAALAVAQVRRAEAARPVAGQRPRLEIVRRDLPEVPAVGLDREQVRARRRPARRPA